MAKETKAGIDYKTINAVLSQCDLISTEGVFSDEVREVIKREA